MRPRIEIYECNKLEDLYFEKMRWNDILDKCNCSVPYLSFEWYICALETINKYHEPLVLFFRCNNEDMALAPLVHKKHKIFGKENHLISFVENPYTPFQGIIYTKDFDVIIQELISYLTQKYGANFVLDLNEIRLNDHEMEILSQLSERGLFIYRVENRRGSRYLKLLDSFEENLDLLDKHAKREFRRKLNRISKLGSIDLYDISDNDLITTNLNTFFKMYERTWKGLEPNQDFYYKICQTFNENEKLLFYALAVDKRPIAYLISIRSGDNVYGVKTTYDPSFYAFSPGIVLFYKFIENLFNLPEIDEFDIGRGDEQFKREWTKQSHPHFRVMIFPNTLYWKVIFYIRYTILPMLKRSVFIEKVYICLRSNVNEKEKKLGNQNKSEETIKKLRYLDSQHSISLEDQYNVRFANNNDIDLLTIAMASRNIQETQDKIQKKKCVLIFKNDELIAFLWFYVRHPDELSKKNYGEIIVDELGFNNHLDNKSREEIMKVSFLNLMKHEIIEKNYYLCYNKNNIKIIENY